MTETDPRLRGLYVLTDARLDHGAALLRAVGGALAGGARLVQYRDKGPDRRRRLEEATALAALCREANALFIVNDDVALAAASAADGVHLGREDATIAAARRRLGAGAIIGASCYNELARAHRAMAEGADYVAFGSFYPSSVKPGAVRADTALLRRARRELALPIAAIGGITPANAPALVAAGADMLAVITGVFADPDPQAAAAHYAAAFD